MTEPGRSPAYVFADWAATLAVAEECGADEDELLRAFVAGWEIAYTLAYMCTHCHYFCGWWSTATLGP